MTARVKGLGHVGIYVQDLDRMVEFYRDFLGMTVTKVSPMAAFLSADPAVRDHEIALIKGRPSLEDPHLIQQISMEVASLADLRDFHRRVLERGFPVDMVVSHASAIGCYFRDPEGNPTEVFWLTGLPSWVILAIPIDLDRSDEDLMADIQLAWEQVGHVQPGEAVDAATSAAISKLMAGTATESATPSDG